MAGWEVNAKRVQRIWRAEGLKVPAKQPKRGRLWLADGSCIRLRPERRNHVWAYDFVAETTHDGRKLRILTVIDEYTRECLALRVARRFTSHDVLYTLSELFLEHGVPQHIRSDNGPEFVATAVVLLRRGNEDDFLCACFTHGMTIPFLGYLRKMGGRVLPDAQHPVFVVIVR